MAAQPRKIPLHADDHGFVRFAQAVLGKQRVWIEYVQGTATPGPTPLQQTYGTPATIEGTAAAINGKMLSIILDTGPVFHLPLAWVTGFVFFADRELASP